jgi:hypothetical protein
MLGVLIELRLQTAPKLKPMQRPEGPAKMKPSKVSGNADHIWQMEVDCKLRGSVNTSTYSHLYWDVQSSTKKPSL